MPTLCRIALCLLTALLLGCGGGGWRWIPQCTSGFRRRRTQPTSALWRGWPRQPTIATRGGLQTGCRFVSPDLAVNPLSGPDQIFEIDSDLRVDSSAGEDIFTPKLALGDGLIAATWEPYWFRQLSPPPRGVWMRLLDLSGQPGHRVASSVFEPERLSHQLAAVTGGRRGRRLHHAAGLPMLKAIHQTLRALLPGELTQERSACAVPKTLRERTIGIKSPQSDRPGVGIRWRAEQRRLL